MTTETPTKAQLEGEVKAFQTEHAEAAKALAAAEEAFKAARNDRSVTMEALLELSAGVNAAKATVDRKAAQIAQTNRRIANYDIIARGAERDGFMAEAKSHLESHITDERAAVYRATGIDRVTFTVDLVADDGKPVRLVNVKPTGAKLTGSTRGGGNGRGFSSAGKVTVDGAEYGSLNKAYITLRAAKDGVEPADVTPANSKSAEAWLAKNGHTISA